MKKAYNLSLIDEKQPKSLLESSDWVSKMYGTSAARAHPHIHSSFQSEYLSVQDTIILGSLGIQAKGHLEIMMTHSWMTCLTWKPRLKRKMSTRNHLSRSRIVG